MTEQEKFLSTYLATCEAFEDFKNEQDNPHLVFLSDSLFKHEDIKDEKSHSVIFQKYRENMNTQMFEAITDVWLNLNDAFDVVTNIKKIFGPKPIINKALITLSGLIEDHEHNIDGFMDENTELLVQNSESTSKNSIQKTYDDIIADYIYTGPSISPLTMANNVETVRSLTADVVDSYSLLMHKRVSFSQLLLGFYNQSLRSNKTIILPMMDPDVEKGLTADQKKSMAYKTIEHQLLETKNAQKHSNDVVESMAYIVNDYFPSSAHFPLHKRLAP